VFEILLELLNIFSREFEKDPNIILDNYNLKDGVYIKLDDTGEIMDHLFVKNKKDDDELFHSEKYEWFKERDYFSSVLNTNKCIANKKIHSNNYFTLFLKIANVEPSNELFSYIDEQYEKLKNPRSYQSNDKNTQKIFDELSKTLPVDDMEKYNIEEYKNIFIDKYEDIKNLLEDIKEKNNEKDTNFKNYYLKIFFDKDINDYKKFYELYTKPRIFTSNSYNREDEEGNIYGLPIPNISLNSKKPFNQLKSTKFEAPFRVSPEQAMNLYNFFEFLSNLKNRYFYFTENSNFKGDYTQEKIDKDNCHFIYKENENGKAVIKDYDFLIDYDNNIKFEYKKIIEPPEKLKMKEEYNPVSRLYELESKVDYYYFSQKLKNNYFEERIRDQSISAYLKEILMITRDSFYSYFKKNKSRDIKVIIEKYGIEIIKENFKVKGDFVLPAFNLYISMKIYFGLGGEKMKDEIKRYLEYFKKNGESLTQLENIEEYSFLSGQIVKFLVGKSKKSKKTHDLASPFLNCTKVDDMKHEIAGYFEKYKHELRINQFRDNLLSVLFNFDNEKEKIDFDMFFAGYLTGENIFYSKKEDRDNLIKGDE
jgi:CRISPR-associated protein Csh1